MPDLASYQNDTSWLLHDNNNLFTPLSQLNRYINQARDRVAQDSGCLRTLVAGQAPFGAGAQVGSAMPGGAILGQSPFTEFNTIAGQEMYPFAYANQTVAAQNRGFKSVVDVHTVAVSWGGAIRPVQNQWTWDKLQAWARSYNIGVFSYPFVWAKSGAGVNNRIWLWPAPSIISEMEWDVTCLPLPLHTTSDYDAISEPFAGAVRYWAAKLAFMSSFRRADADAMEKEYWTSLVKSGSVTDRAGVPDYYADLDW